MLKRLSATIGATWVSIATVRSRRCWAFPTIPWSRRVTLFVSICARIRSTALDGWRRKSSQIAYLTPDVIIREEEEKLVAEVVESQRYFLRLSPLYQELSRQPTKGEDAQVTPEEKEHLTQFVGRAQLFLTNLRQRRETIRRISEYLIQRQEQFLRNGVRHLRPLTRAEVASAIGVHESTVSRATANKHVQMPSHEVIPFSHFFTASLSVKDVLNELISNEKRPLTDQELVEMLRSRGFDVARRTVAKYRNQLGILASTLR